MVMKIKLNNLEEVKDFVNSASKCYFDIDISYNRYTIDAKSLLGVLSMELNNVLTVSCREYDENFANTLKKYEIVT